MGNYLKTFELLKTLALIFVYTVCCLNNYNEAIQDVKEETDRKILTWMHAHIVKYVWFKKKEYR